MDGWKKSWEMLRLTTPGSVDSNTISTPVYCPEYEVLWLCTMYFGQLKEQVNGCGKNPVILCTGFCLCSRHSLSALIYWQVEWHLFSIEGDNINIDWCGWDRHLNARASTPSYDFRHYSILSLTDCLIFWHSAPDKNKNASIGMTRYIYTDSELGIGESCPNHLPGIPAPISGWNLTKPTTATCIYTPIHISFCHFTIRCLLTAGDSYSPNLQPYCPIWYVTAGRPGCCICSLR